MPSPIAPVTDKAVDYEGDAVMASARSSSDTQQHQHAGKKIGSTPTAGTNQNQQQARKSGTTFGRLRVVTAPATCVQDLQVISKKYLNMSSPSVIFTHLIYAHIFAVRKVFEFLLSSTLFYVTVREGFWQCIR
jgi:hypothetical protein